MAEKHYLSNSYDYIYWMPESESWLIYLVDDLTKVRPLPLCSRVLKGKSNEKKAAMLADLCIVGNGLNLTLNFPHMLSKYEKRINERYDHLDMVMDACYMEDMITHLKEYKGVK